MLCVCAKQGTLTEGKSLSGKKKRHHGEKISVSNFATLRKQPPGLRSPNAAIPLHLVQWLKPRGGVAFRAKHFVLPLQSSTIMAPSPGETYRPSFTLDHEAPAVVAGSSSHLTANAHNSEGKKDELMYIEMWILTELFIPSHQPLGG